MEERDKIVHEARKQAEIAAQKELDAVKQQIQIEKDEAIRDIRRQVAVLSVDIAEKVLRSVTLFWAITGCPYPTFIRWS